MINHMNNQPRMMNSGSTSNNTFIVFVNNKDEAMMVNVPKGCTAYIYEIRNPVFYVKECDAVTGQITFSEYNYTEVIPQPAPDPANFVTKNDMELFKNDIMTSISALLTKQREGEICG